MEDHSDNEMIPREGTEDQRKKFSLGSAIEVPILLIMFGIALTEAPITNILLYRICVHSLGYPTQDCRALYLDMMRGNKSQAMEDAVQKYSTLVGGVKSVMEALLPAILSLFVVVWSDRHGRKPLLVWSMLGMAGTSFLIVVYAMMEGLGPWWFILCSVPYSLSGGFSILGTAAVCYVTDFTKQNSRSFRLMIVQTTFAVGMAAGNLASPHLLQAMGGVYLLLFAAALLSLGYVFTAIFIKESIPNVTPGSITTILDFSLVTDMFKECFKRRPNRLRSQILLLTGANSLSTFTVYGSAVISYLYTRRMFDWGLTEFTQYTAVSICISFVGAFLGVAVIQRILPIGDLTFSIIAFLSTSVAFYIRGFAVVSWHMYLSSVVSLFGGLPGPLIRSFLSKALPAEDISSVFGLMGAIEGLCPLVAPVFYNALYAQTIATVPGAVMLVTSGMSLVCVILLGVVVFCRWNSTSTGYEPLQAEA